MQPIIMRGIIRDGRKCVAKHPIYVLLLVTACAIVVVTTLRANACSNTHIARLHPSNSEDERARASWEGAPPTSPCSRPSDISAWATAVFNSSSSIGAGDDVHSANANAACPRSFRIPHSAMPQDDAARARCQSSIAYAGDNDAAKGHPTSPATICVFYLNYRNLDNLVTSVQSHALRSAVSPRRVSHNVLTMDEDERDVDAARAALEPLASVHRLSFPPGTVGGEPLPSALHAISLLSTCPVTVVSDSDVFMLRDGWDKRVADAFETDPALALFASNPRHHSHGSVFQDTAEWNWMAYRTSVFAGMVVGGLNDGVAALPDVGHYYSHCARAATARQMFLRGTAWPYEGKAATIASDTDGSPWILHLFYASRHKNEPEHIKAEARKYSLSGEQLAQLRFNLTRTRRLDPRAAFGMAEWA